MIKNNADEFLDDDLITQANRSEQACDDLLSQYEVLDSKAEFYCVLFDGNQFGLQAHVGSDEEADFWVYQVYLILSKLLFY